MEPITKNWTDENGDHQGGVSTGIGFTVSWQRGPLNEAGRNGAFLIEVLEACESQLRYLNDGKYSCSENEYALMHLAKAIDALKERRDRRRREGVLGTQQV